MTDKTPRLDDQCRCGHALVSHYGHGNCAECECMWYVGITKSDTQVAPSPPRAWLYEWIGYKGSTYPADILSFVQWAATGTMWTETPLYAAPSPSPQVAPDSLVADLCTLSDWLAASVLPGYRQQAMAPARAAARLEQLQRERDEARSDRADMKRAVQMVQESCEIGMRESGEAYGRDVASACRERNAALERAEAAEGRLALATAIVEREGNRNDELNRLKAQHGLQRVYQPCPRHWGQSWTGVTTVMNLPIIVCPICEPGSIRSETPASQAGQPADESRKAD